MIFLLPNIPVKLVVACGIYPNAYNATMAEAEVSKSTGSVQVKRVVIALDIGVVLNPDGLRQQAEGGVTMGRGNALTEEVRFRGGARTHLTRHSRQLSEPATWLLLRVNTDNRPAIMLLFQTAKLLPRATWFVAPREGLARHDAEAQQSNWSQAVCFSRAPDHQESFVHAATGMAKGRHEYYRNLYPKADHDDADHGVLPGFRLSCLPAIARKRPSQH